MSHLKPVHNSNERIRNVRAFVKSYLDSKSGEKALQRSPYRDTKTGENVWRSSTMPMAFQRAIQ